MGAFIAHRIESTYDYNGLTAAQEAYRHMFIATTMYAKYRAECDAVLTSEGYTVCIVAE